MATVSANAPGASSLHCARKLWTGRTSRAGPRRAGVGRRFARDFVSFAGPRLLISALLILVGTALEGVGILLILPLLRVVFDAGTRRGPANGLPFEGLLDPLARDTQCAILFAGFGALMLLRAIVLVARDTQLARLQWGFIERIKLGLFNRLAAASWKVVMAIDRPRLTRALGGDMMQVGMAVNAALQTGAATVMLTAYCAFALVLAPGLSLITFGILAAVSLAGAVFVRRAGAFGRSILGYELRKEESAQHFFTGLKLAKAQGLEAGFVASYAAAAAAALDTRLAFIRTMSTSRQLAALLGAVAAGASVVVAILRADTDPALLVTFVVLLARTAAPVSQLQQGVQQVANALPLFAELHDLGSMLPFARLASPTAPASSRRARSVSLRAASVTHVTSEGHTQGGISGVDLDIRPGEFVGLSGPTGSGKSTLLDLLAGLQTPDAGEVLFDGLALSAAEADAHRGGLAYLAADPVLFGGSIRSNLSWAAPSAGESLMWQALTLATAAELVDRLGRGLDSRIHDLGTNLSAGERQQIAIARALLRRPSLLLLDEATSSLDSDRERRVLANLASLAPRPTIVLVSHRAESFAQCDRVISLSEGEILSIRRVR